MHAASIRNILDQPGTITAKLGQLFSLLAMASFIELVNNWLASYLAIATCLHGYLAMWFSYLNF